jgi:tRNA-2-methylthio-N6-dimethylallyladenosine synthase
MLKEHGNPLSDVRIFLETFGCQMNVLDSELVEGQLKAAGHRFVLNAEEANVILLNTCAVRYQSEHKVLSRLGKIKERKEKGEQLVVGILGCMAERANDELAKKQPFIDLMIGPSKIQDTLRLVEHALNKTQRLETKKSLSYFSKRKGHQEKALSSSLDDLEALDRNRPLSERAAPWQAYVRITRGCNKFCSFCVVPRTRGPELHRPPDSIIEEVKRLVDNGAKEVTLLGQTINHYFFEGSKRWSFADLLFGVHEQVPDLKRLRFLTSYPRDFTDEALDVMKTCERICKYLHIPAQSGSDKVLRDMNRGYDLATYMGLIERAKSRMPQIALVGDMIVGYPTESDKDFLLSLELLRQVRYKNVFVFKYSPRPNTVAYTKFTDCIPLSVKKLRNTTMLALQNEISFQHHQNLVDKEVIILCQDHAKLDIKTSYSDLVPLRLTKREEVNLTGRTEGDHIVHFRGPSSLIGSLVKVKIVKARPLSLDGCLVQEGFQKH